MGTATKITRLKTTGFTLVEMLVVIVVIAILATVTIVGYNGAQDRAKQTVTLNAFDQYEQMLKSYNTSNGYFPPTQTFSNSNTLVTNIGNAAGMVCLGVNGPADTPMAANQCVDSTSNSSLDTYENTAIDTALKTVSRSLQNSVGKIVKSTDGTSSMRGVSYLSQRSAAGTSTRTILFMSPVGGKDCGRGTYYAAGATEFGSLIPLPVCMLDMTDPTP